MGILTAPARWTFAHRRLFRPYRWGPVCYVIFSAEVISGRVRFAALRSGRLSTGWTAGGSAPPTAIGPLLCKSGLGMFLVSLRIINNRHGEPYV